MMKGLGFESRRGTLFARLENRPDYSEPTQLSIHCVTGFSLRGKAAATWGWPLTFIQCRG